nr:LLM class flavin-dependent oxidoreductase [Rubrobacter marinus]
MPLVRRHGRQPRRRPRRALRRGGEVPVALTDYIKARQSYDYSHHGKAGNPTTDFVPDGIVDRFCVLGTAEDHAKKLTELKELGVDQFNVYLMHDAMEETLEAYGREIMPALGARVDAAL